MLKQKIQELIGYDAYQYAQSQGTNIGGFWDFWESFRLWLDMRPQRRQCAFCGTKIWVVNVDLEYVFCSQSCYDYGPQTQDCPDCHLPLAEGDHIRCIPF